MKADGIPALAAVLLRGDGTNYGQHIQQRVLAHARKCGYRREAKLRGLVREHRINPSTARMDLFDHEVRWLAACLSFEAFEAILAEANQRFLTLHPVH